MFKSAYDLSIMGFLQMFLLWSLLLQVKFISVAAGVIFEDCGSAYELEMVNITGCGLRLPCYVTLGEDIPVTVKFLADFTSRSLDQNVVININFINLVANVTPEPCETVDCPVRTDAVTAFTSVLSVPTNIALNQRGYLRWKVYNEDGRLVLCYSVLVQIQSPLQKFLREALNFTNENINVESALMSSEAILDHPIDFLKDLNGLNATDKAVLSNLIAEHHNMTKIETGLSNNNVTIRNHTYTKDIEPSNLIQFIIKYFKT